ncbi:MAG TPA: transcriptional repressor [Candidatus Kapabacteria bacterium]
MERMRLCENFGGIEREVTLLSVIIPNKQQIESTPKARATRQRMAVLHAVESVRTHPSAEEVYRVVKKKLPNISLGTTYRNLHLLVEEGKLRKVQFLGDVLRYDAMTAPHEHFYCAECHAVWDLAPSLPSETVRKVERKMHARIERYALDYYGQCEACSKKN